MSELKAFSSERIYWAVEQVERVAGDIDRLHLDDNWFHLKSEVDTAITELKARIHELESIPHTDNSAVIERLSNENERLKAKLESVQATAYAESVESKMQRSETDSTMTDVTISRQSASHSTRRGRKARQERSPCTTAESDTGLQKTERNIAEKKVAIIFSVIAMTPHGVPTGSKCRRHGKQDVNRRKSSHESRSKTRLPCKTSAQSRCTSTKESHNGKH